MLERLLLNTFSGGSVGGPREELLDFYTYTNIGLKENGWVPTCGENGGSGGNTRYNFNFGQEPFLNPLVEGYRPFDPNYDESLWVGVVIRDDGAIHPRGYSQGYYDKVVNTGKRYFEVTMKSHKGSTFIGMGRRYTGPSGQSASNIKEGSMVVDLYQKRVVVLDGESKTWIKSSEAGFESNDVMCFFLDFDNDAVLILKHGVGDVYVESSKEYLDVN